MKNENRLAGVVIYFILIVTPLLFFTDLTRNPYYTQITLLHISILLLAVIFLISALLSGRLELPRTPLDAPILGFLAIAAVSLVFSFIKHPVGYLRYSLFSEGSSRIFFTVVNCIMAYYAAYHYVDRSNRKNYLIVSLLVGAAAGLYGIMQYFGLEFIWPKAINPYGVRSVSTFGNPNFLSSYLVMLMPVSLGFFILSRKMAGRFVFILMALVFTGSIVVSLTRSSWIGVVSAVFVFIAALAIFDRVYLRKVLVGVTVFISIMLCVALFWPKGKGEYSPSVKERIQEIASAKHGVYNSLHQRLLIWKCSWDMLDSNPVVGIGWGAMELFYPFYQGRMLLYDVFSSLRTHANNSHNEILEILSQVGLAGFGVYIWLLYCAFYMICKILCFYRGGDKESFVIAAALGCALVGMLADNLFNVSLHFAVPGFLYWWFLGIAAGFSKERSGGKSVFAFKTSAAGVKPVLIFLVIVCIFLIYRCYAFQMNQSYFFKGFKLSQQAGSAQASDASRIRLLRSSEQLLSKAHSYRRLEVNNNYEMGNVHARLKNRDKALWSYSEALSSNAGYDEIHYNMASMFYQAGDFKEAVKYFAIANFINPLNKETYTGLSNIYIKLIGEGADAAENQSRLEELLLAAVKVFPKERDFWNNLGYVYIATKRYDEAIKAYEQTLKIDPFFKPGKDNLIFCMKNLGMKSHPLLEAEDKLALIPGLINTGNTARAKEIAEAVLEISPDHPLAHMYMGNILFNRKEFAEAADSYNRALELSPDNVSVLMNLGAANLMLKDHSRAKQAYGRVAELTKDKRGFEANYKEAVERIGELNRF